MTTVVGLCRALIEGTSGDAGAILAGFYDDEHRADGLKAIADCRDFLSSILAAAAVAEAR